MLRNAKMKLNITGGNRGNSSDSAFYCSDNTQKCDALQSSGSCDAERVIKPNCSSDGCNCSNCFTRKPRKRKRLYSWQRRSKQKQFCNEDKLTELSKLNDSYYTLCNLLSDGSAAGVNGQTHSLKHTADNISIGMNNGEFVSQTEEPCNVPVLSLKKPPSSVLDTSPSQDLLCGYSKSGVQCTSPKVGPSSYSQLNVSSFPISCYLLLPFLLCLHSSSVYLPKSLVIPFILIFDYCCNVIVSKLYSSVKSNNLDERKIEDANIDT